MRSQGALRKSGLNSRSESSFVLVLIGSFKLLKALLLILVGIVVLHYLHKDVGSAALHWIRVLRVDPDNEFVHRILVKIFGVTPKQLAELSVGTFLYAGLFATEGFGLLLRKRWAEYFTVITTGTLIPLEIFELARHFTASKVLVTAINVVIVWYLAARVRSRRGGPTGKAEATARVPEPVRREGLARP